MTSIIAIVLITLSAFIVGLGLLTFILWLEMRNRRKFKEEVSQEYVDSLVNAPEGGV